MKKVAIYSRKSVLVEGSVSIETQINMCKDYINNYEKSSYLFKEICFS
nr:MAG TPA: hypothetical protein [Caudoviricetes sp.]